MTGRVFERAASIIGVERVFGPPHEQDGVTVIPAASVRGGGGGGGDENEGETSEGGGFGVSARPVGALVIEDGEVRWEVPFSVNKVIAGGQLLVATLFLFVWLTQRSRSKAAVKVAQIAARSVSEPAAR